MKDCSYMNDHQVGEKIESRGRIMTDADIRLLIASSGGEHPLHTDPIFASKMPVKRLIVQGSLILGVVDAFFSESVFCHGEKAITYGYEKIRFVRPIFINDVVRGEFELISCEKKDDRYGLMTYQATVYNQNNEVVFIAVETFAVNQ